MLLWRWWTVLGAWLLRRARWVLAGSLAVHLLVTALATDMFDLRVYWLAAPRLLDGHLYDVTLVRPDPGSLPLPFTYPPFAAVALLPTAVLPWPAATWAWHAASLASLAVLVHCSLRLCPGRSGPVGPEHTMVWTAAALWLEPVRHCLDLGQIDLLLAAVVLAGLTTRRAAAGGLGVGLSAGVKLTPAVVGVYFLVARRWQAAGWTVAVFAATVGLTWLVDARDSRRYWLQLVGQSDRVGPVAAWENESLGGVLSRFAGHGMVLTPTWLGLALAALLGTALALRASLRRGDTLAAVVAVQLLGLLVCPISWSHHWVWAVPALICLGYGGGPPRRAALAAIVAWGLAAGAWLVPLAGELADGTGPSGYLFLLSASYPVCAALTLVALARRAGGPDRRQGRGLAASPGGEPQG
ncbi:glycosyltransferase 87 family protein [Kitasatospora sp. NPDC058965]|uniref:glycosyltransferase 87 family protein n=1 Tax=Kitasatospora sp. NPDC058965 TaxID=3346682 RepID=UPI0036979D61